MELKLDRESDALVDVVLISAGRPEVLVEEVALPAGERVVPVLRRPDDVLTVKGPVRVRAFANVLWFEWDDSAGARLVGGGPVRLVVTDDSRFVGLVVEWGKQQYDEFAAQFSRS
ncbi:hypothetical protein [Actinokineospora sp. NBRC 105648]|uniref:hypothetical protein n=1 Tax=Actinokineospora sp. NBRC 105648 TaxID=3032206 RepID=UPI00255276E4|nr:hypothetical protein [Actinokineospora sp. NBRC 105648]